MKKYCIISIALIVILLAGCADEQVMDGDGMFQTFEYKQITQDEAKQMIEKDDGHVIVDVRREDEYAQGHIPGAILIPNESIDNVPPEELPDPSQIILVYCRSGRRSKEASQKLADMGYENVYEFGGIIDWDGDIVSDEAEPEKKAEISFESFDGGGPNFNIVLGDESIVSYDKSKKYNSPDHEQLDGAGYMVVYSFTGLKPGETEMMIEERSPIADNIDHIYSIKVDEDLNVEIELLETRDAL